MTDTRIALVRREVNDLLLKQKFFAATQVVDGNLSKRGEPRDPEPAAYRELIIKIHREAVKAGSEEARLINLRYGDVLTDPVADFDDIPTLTGEALAEFSNR